MSFDRLTSVRPRTPRSGAPTHGGGCPSALCLRRHEALEVAPDPRQKRERHGGGGEIERRMDERDLHAGFRHEREQRADGELHHGDEEREAAEVEHGVEEREAAGVGAEGRGVEERDPAGAEVGADDHPDREGGFDESAGDGEHGEADDDGGRLHEHRQQGAEGQGAQRRRDGFEPMQDLGRAGQRHERRVDEAEREEDQAEVEDGMAIGAPATRTEQRPQAADGDEDRAHAGELVSDEPGGEGRADVGADHDRPGGAHGQDLLFGQSHGDEVHHRRGLDDGRAERAGERAAETVGRHALQDMPQLSAAEARDLAGEIPEAVQVEHDRRDGGEEEVHGRGVGERGWGIEDGVRGVGTAPRAVLCAKVQIGLRPVQKCKGERHRFRWRVAAPGGWWREMRGG